MHGVQINKQATQVPLPAIAVPFRVFVRQVLIMVCKSLQLSRAYCLAWLQHQQLYLIKQYAALQKVCFCCVRKRTSLVCQKASVTCPRQRLGSLNATRLLL